MSFAAKNNLKNFGVDLICRVIVLILIVFFVHSISDRLTVSNAKELKDPKKMNQTNKKEVSPGVWGGTGINLTVEEDGVKIEYDCAEAEINEKLMIDKKGKFSVEGTYLRRNPGAIRLKFKPKNQPAMFVGKISDKKMTLTVTLTENKEEIGNYTLERDKTARLRRCL